jgi:hypothetical protein
MIKTKSQYNKLIDRMITFSSETKEHRKDPKGLDTIKVFNTWKEIFTGALEYWGFNDPAISSLFNWGCSSLTGYRGEHNWKKLHSTDEEILWSSEEKLQRFLSEVSYISDRITLDRLFRTHWLFNFWCSSVPELEFKLYDS